MRWKGDVLQCEQDMSDGRETCCSVSRICQMEGRRVAV